MDEVSSSAAAVPRTAARAAGGVFGIGRRILAFGLLGLGLRAVPTVLADDLQRPGRRPRGTATPSPTTVAPSGPTHAPAGPSARAEQSATPTARGRADQPEGDDRSSVPATGPGTYETAARVGGAGLDRGRLIRFDVRVEKNLEIDPDEAAEFIAGVLNDERSWRGTGRWRFELVSGGRAGRPARLHRHPRHHR